MNIVLSYLFSVFILCLFVILSKRKKRVIGIDRDNNGINVAWIYLYLLLASYMLTYMDYCPIIFLSIFFFFPVICNLTKTKVPFNKEFFPLYLLFCLWCGIRLFDSLFIFKGLMMAIKVIMPLLLFSYSYCAFTKKESVWSFFDRISRLSVLYLICSILSRALSDNFEIYPYFGMTIFPFTIVMLLKTHDKKYLLYSILCLSNNLIYIKRTPLLAMLLMLAVIFLFKYKLKSVALIAFTTISFIVAILFIPALNERVFFDYIDPSEIDWGNVFSEESFSMINTHGRDATWNMLIERFYKNHELIGGGLGSAKGWLQSPQNPVEAFALVHNDWLQFLCEVGIIGVTLLSSFFIFIIHKSYRIYQKSKSKELRLIALFVAMMTTGIVCHMFFENCFGNIGYCMPFVSLAIMIRYKQFLRNEANNFNSATSVNRLDRPFLQTQF